MNELEQLKLKQKAVCTCIELMRTIGKYSLNDKVYLELVKEEQTLKDQIAMIHLAEMQINNH